MELTKRQQDIMDNPGSHFYLQDIITKGAKRDIVDTINDLEHALDTFREEWQRHIKEAGL